MFWRRPFVALLMSLLLFVGAVAEATSRHQMAAGTEFVLCGTDGQTVIKLDDQGRKVQPHPCTHCLAASALGLPLEAQPLQPPMLLRGLSLRPGLAAQHERSASLTPSARGPPLHLCV